MGATVTEDDVREAVSEPVEASLPAPLEMKTQKGREIMALRVGHEVRPILPANVEEAFRFAQMVCAAGLAPDSYKNDPNKVVVGVLTALEIGVPPLQGLSGIYIVNGRPTVWGDLALALIQSKGLVENHEDFYEGTPGADDYTSVYRIWRKGQTKPYEGKFSIGNAKKARLWLNAKKTPWMEYPERMLFNRARAFALRDGFSDALKGLAITEEARDLPETPPPVNPAFLEDETPPALVQIEGGVSETAEERAEAPDLTREELDGYITALKSIRDAGALDDLTKDVRAFLKEKGRDDLLGIWNGARLERLKTLPKAVA